MTVDAGNVTVINYRVEQTSVNGPYTFSQQDSGGATLYTGSTDVVWTVPDLAPGTWVAVHNMSDAAMMTFAVAPDVGILGARLLAAGGACWLQWLSNGVVRIGGNERQIVTVLPTDHAEHDIVWEVFPVP